MHFYLKKKKKQNFILSCSYEYEKKKKKKRIILNIFDRNKYFRIILSYLFSIFYQIIDT